MKKLTEYVRGLSLEERLAFAQRAGTTWLQVRNMAFSGKGCGPVLAAALERASAGAVRRWDLRPADWHDIWPELVGADGAPAPATGNQAAA
jgi:DNA-binding transcriptional regulator YdaS (Cro superfamily)